MLLQDRDEPLLVDRPSPSPSAPRPTRSFSRTLYMPVIVRLGVLRLLALAVGVELLAEVADARRSGRRCRRGTGRAAKQRRVVRSRVVADPEASRQPRAPRRGGPATREPETKRVVEAIDVELVVRRARSAGRKTKSSVLRRLDRGDVPRRGRRALARSLGRGLAEEPPVARGSFARWFWSRSRLHAIEDVAGRAAGYASGACVGCQPEEVDDVSRRGPSAARSRPFMIGPNRRAAVASWSEAECRDSLAVDPEALPERESTPGSRGPRSREAATAAATSAPTVRSA